MYEAPSRIKGLIYEESVNIVSVEFEMSMDQVSVQRNIYTSLDLLSDIGGIQGILFSLFAIIVALFNTDHFDEYFIARLYNYSS